MKNTLFFLFALLMLGSPVMAQTPQNAHASAALEIDSTTKGFLPPRMTTTQRDAITTPAVGLIIYNTSTNKLNLYIDTWVELTSGEADTVVSASGEIWKSKNLGARQIATSSSDPSSYGYIYQWGRNSDGHEFRASATTTGPVASGSEGNNFITNTTAPNDWLSTQDDTRWGATKTANDPCPTGYRVPTETELSAERLLFATYDAAGAFGSELKFPAAGYRNPSTGALGNVGSTGHYWSSTVYGTSGRYLFFSRNDANMYSNDRANGFSVRCIKE